jgi:glycerophosphoryl diester phosphodiesterase
MPALDLRNSAVKAYWPYPRVIAHRGGGGLAPENTLAAIRTGAQRGFAGVEFDVMLSRDSVPVLIHDDNLERTTNGAGAVANAAWKDLAALDAGSWFGAAFAGEPLPSYADAARLCVDLGLWANVEIKPAAGFERETGKLVAAMSGQLWRAAPLAPLFSSFSMDALEAAAAAAPGLARGLLVEAIPEDWRDAVARLGCVSLHCSFRHLTRAQARAVKDEGCALLCYTVNDPATARELFEWGIDAVVTDRLDLIPPDLAAGA